MTLVKWMDIFGDNLASILEEKGMTQKDLVMDSGLSAGSINAYIHKQSPPGVKAIINLATALDMSIDDLIDFGERIE
jgi:transcriptional regulator with XRE-family HTH domain